MLILAIQLLNWCCKIEQFLVFKLGLSMIDDFSFILLYGGFI